MQDHGGNGHGRMLPAVEPDVAEMASSKVTVSATARACCSSREMVAGGSFGWPVYEPKLAWLPPAISMTGVSGGRSAIDSGEVIFAAPESSEPYRTTAETPLADVSD